MKFVMMSDTHYISRRMIDDKSDGELMLQPAVTEQAVLQATESSDTLFIIGDLTDMGDRYSHEDFAAFLQTIKARGKKIYVTFATHDYHHHKAYVQKPGSKIKYKCCPWNLPYFDIDKVNFHDLVTDEFKSLSEEECRPALVEALSPQEIWELYYQFGAAEAYSVNEESFSYCLDLDENTRCLMLNDIFRNEEAMHDLSPTYAPSCLRWIKQMRDEAERDGKFIFACSHHPMMPAVPAHRIGAGKRNRDMRAPVVGHTLADLGISLIFNGHSHFCDTGYLKSDEGNLICSVTTPSVRFYPPAYREIELDAKMPRLKYNCIYINIPDGCEIAENSLFEHYHKQFYDEYYQKITGSSAFVKKIMDNARVKDIYFLVKKNADLSDEEYMSIKDIKLFDLILETAFNMLIGDGRFTPDTPEYKVMMSLCAVLDSVIDTQPFADIKKNNLGGYSIGEIIEPMLFNNYTPDREADFDFTVEPKKTVETPVYKSGAGYVIMGVIYAAALLLSFTAPVAVAVGIPVKMLLKGINNKKYPVKPADRYY